MPYEIRKLTPNLIVSSVEQSLAFYCDVLGFTKTDTVPNHRRTCSRSCSRDPWRSFSTRPGPAAEEYPALAGKGRSAAR